MAEVYYMQIDSITGPVTVEQFTGCFQLEHFSGGDVINHFTRTKHGPTFHGIPKFEDIAVTVCSVDGATASKIYKSTIDALPHATITIYSVGKTNGKEQPNSKLVLTDAFVHQYEEVYSEKGMNLNLVLGSPAKLEKTFYTYDETGQPTPSVVIHDFVASTTT